MKLRFAEAVPVVFYKPFNVLCQFTQKSIARKTLADFVPVRGVYPAARLDYDSEGLVLLTDDGELQHRLTDPTFAHPRTYGAGGRRRLRNKRCSGCAVVFACRIM